MHHLNQAAPWSHLYAFDFSSTPRNRNLRGLEITPVHSAYTTAHVSPGDGAPPDSGIWNPPQLHESFQVSNSTCCYVDRSPPIPFVPQVSSTGHVCRLGDEPNSGVSPTSGVQAWPSPPDSGVVFVSDDNFTNSKCAGVAEPYGFNPPVTLSQMAKAVDQGTTDLQSSIAPFSYELSQYEQTQDYQFGHERRISSDTGYETLDHDMDGLPLYQLDDHPDHQNHVEVNPLQPTAIVDIEQPSTARIERPSIESPCEGTCEHSQPDVALSFSPTAGSFPEFWSLKTEARPVQQSKSTSGSFAFRPAARNPRVGQKASVPTVEAPLSVIHEYRKGAPSSSHQATRKGRRAGPLSKAKATQAAIIRKNKSVCIRCKMMKQSVRHRVYAKSFAESEADMTYSVLGRSSLPWL